MKKTQFFGLTALAFVMLTSFVVYGQEKVPCPEIIVDGHKYSTNPCSINLTMISGKEDKTFRFTIMPDDLISYGFTIPSYGYFFPTLSLLPDPASGGAKGTQFITVKVMNAKLPLEYNGKRKVYRGYLPIYVYKPGEKSTDTNFIKLPITITVKPDVKSPVKPSKK